MINKSQLESLIQSKVDTKTFNDTSNDFLSNVLSADQISEDRSFYVETVDDLPNIYYNQIPNGFVAFVKSINVPLIASDNEWIGLDGRVLKSFNEVTQALAWGQNRCGALGDGTVINRSSPVTVVGGFTDWISVKTTKISQEYGSAGLRSNGTIWTWGCNNLGTLGDGTPLNRSSPVSVTGGFTDWCKVSASRQINVGLRSNGTLWGWGSSVILKNNPDPNLSPVLITGERLKWNYVKTGCVHGLGISIEGQLWAWGQNRLLGFGDFTGNASCPILINSNKNWCAISLGTCHSLALNSSGQLWSWGINSLGQLGTNNTVNCFTIENLSVFNDWTNISAGYFHSLAIRNNGTLWTWGQNQCGALGDGTTINRSSPVTVVGGFTDWCQVSASGTNSAAIRTSGTLWSWGFNNSGQLGDGTTIDRSSPVSVIGGFTDWCKVSVSENHALAIRNNGTLWAWGCNGSGSLGDGTTINRSSPVILSNNVNESWNNVSSGQQFSVATTKDKLWAWGQSLRNGISSQNTSSPVRILLNPNTCWKSISSGFNTSFVIDQFGRALGWGANSCGQLANNSNCNVPNIICRVPVEIKGNAEILESDWIDVCSNQVSILAIKCNNTLWGIGESFDGTTGTGSYKDNSFIFSPKQELGKFNDWSQISLGKKYFLGLRSNGTIWGSGNVEPLAQGQGFRAYSPIKTLCNNWCQVSNGCFHSMAININGGLFGWGSGLNGRLGLGNESYKFSPTLVGPHWKEISRHNSHTLAIYNDGTLWSWGYNGSGNLGDGTEINRSSPVTVVGGFTDWCQISTGVSTSGAIRSNGTLWTWGGNSSGTLGDGTTVYRSSPVSVIGGFTDWCRIKTRSYHTLAIRSNGTLWSWGKAVNGELGTNNLIERSSPVSVVGGFTNWCDISTGFIHSVGLRNNGTLWAWGYNGKGEIGDGTKIWRSSPVSVIGGFTDWCKIGSSQNSVFAIRNNGTLWSWGCGRCGTLGNGTTIDTSSPAQVVGGFSNWCDIDSGVNEPIAQQSNGSIWVWGAQSGDGTTINRSSPVQLAGSQTDWCKITGYTLVKSNGTLWNWGFNLGNNTTFNSSSPVSIIKQPSTWCQVSAAPFHTIAIRCDSSIWSWGADRFSRLGLGVFPENRNQYWSPVPIKGCQCDWIKLSTGYRTAVALKNNGTIWTWGVGVALGIGGDFVCGSPVSVLGGFTDWCDIASGECHVLALRNNGTLWAWGYNDKGNLGSGSTTCRASPIQEISYATDWCGISAGFYSSTAIKTNGTLWAWGNNDSGQVGDGTEVNRSSPVTVVGGFTDWCQVNSGGFHTAAIRNNGTLWTWGGNIYGQLGDRTSDYRSSPVSVVTGFTDWCQVNTYITRTSAIRSNGEIWNWGEFLYSSLGNGVGGFVDSPVSIIGGFTDWCQVNAGSYHAAAVRQNGTLWAWGLNGFLQVLGSGCYSRAEYSPVSVIGGFTDWCQVSAGRSSNAAVRLNGTLWTWGLNNVGQLGDSTTINRSSPVSVIGGFTDWCQVSVGYRHTLGIRRVG